MQHTIESLIDLIYRENAVIDQVEQVLIQCPELINQLDKYGELPLLGAVDKNNIDMSKLLIKYGADVNKKTGKYNGRSPFLLAIWREHTQLVELMLDSADFSICDDGNSGVFHQVCLAAIPNSQILEILKKRPGWESFLSKGNKWGVSPLHYSAYKDLDVTEKLIISGANVNAQTVERSTIRISGDAHTMIDPGMTPLHVVAMKGDLEHARLLLRFNASSLINDWYGRNAVETAKLHNRTEMADVLSHNLQFEQATNEVVKYSVLLSDKAKIDAVVVKQELAGICDEVNASKYKQAIKDFPDRDTYEYSTILKLFQNLRKYKPTDFSEFQVKLKKLKREALDSNSSCKNQVPALLESIEEIKVKTKEDLSWLENQWYSAMEKQNEVHGQSLVVELQDKIYNIIDLYEKLNNKKVSKEFVSLNLATEMTQNEMNDDLQWRLSIIEALYFLYHEYTCDRVESALAYAETDLKVLSMLQ
eukprot:NODE_254_length_12812_cov_0.286872.p2 type:complete len:476 gc:universal NODE_254_length_12812_cov_0.286872:992-2419(+)